MSMIVYDRSRTILCFLSTLPRDLPSIQLRVFIASSFGNTLESSLVNIIVSGHIFINTAEVISINTVENICIKQNCQGYLYQ